MSNALLFKLGEIVVPIVGLLVIGWAIASMASCEMEQSKARSQRTPEQICADRAITTDFCAQLKKQGSAKPLNWQTLKLNIGE